MPATVLIVDDYPPFRRAARRLLERSGYEVVGEAEDGRSALAAVGKLRPGVVLLDLQLPDMSGFDVAERVSQEHVEVSVVLTSTHDGEDFGALVAESGACGFVPKAELSGPALDALVA